MDGAAARGDQPPREKWASKTEFVLSCLGYAIGLGNVWRFPYLSYRNGGGAFLVPYLLMLILCGIPLFYLEINLGQFTSLGCMSIYRLAPIFKGAAYAMIVVNLICTCYYTTIITYPVLFIVQSFGDQLPWENCDNAWNTDMCLALSAYTTDNITLLEPSSPHRTPADEFFHNKILDISAGIDHLGGVVEPILWGNIFVWIVMYFCIMNGVKSVGKVVYFTATFPFVILAVLFVRGVTLPGAIDGIRFYVTPVWSELGNLQVWTDAAVQIFFSLGPGWGGILNMASYNDFRNNTKWDCILIPVINCTTSIFAGFVVFSVLGFMSHRTGIPVAHVATGGPGLAFVTYPEAIAMMPYPNMWAVLFFVMLFLLGIDSVFVQFESIISAILDELPQLRPHQRLVTLFVMVLMFGASIVCNTRGGMYIVQLLDWYSAAVPVILICMIELLAIAWFYGVDNFARDIEFMTGRRPSRLLCCCWRFVTPAILLTIFCLTLSFTTAVTYNGLAFPQWSIAVGWTTCATSIMCIPAYMVYRVCKMRGSLVERVAKSFRLADMRPAEEPYRSEYVAMLNAEAVAREKYNASWF